ncbi:MAG TPA: FG-GAP-like repeat-containing protein [Pyrinomonadaceae bacterium]
MLLTIFALAGFGQIVRAADGDLDPAFGNGGKVLSDLSGGIDNLSKIALQPDGKILAVGNYRLSNGNSHIELARYNANGTLDTTFGTGGRVTTIISNSGDFADDVIVQPDNKILVGGSVSSPGVVDSSFLLVRYNPDGTLDTTFGTGGLTTTNIGDYLDGITAIALQADGKIVASGFRAIVRPPGEERNADIALARYNSNGTLDTTFGTNGKTISDFGPVADYFADDATDVIVLPDGKIVIVGDSDGGGYYDFLIARYNANGTLDTSFGTNGRTKTDLGNGYQDGASGAALQPDGKIVSVGAALPSSYDLDFSLIRYNPNGSLDPTFGTGGKVVFGLESLHDEELSDVVIQSDGKILALGDSNSSNNSGFLLLRFNPDGTRDTSFGSNGIVRTPFGSNAAYTTALLLQPDAKIIAAGYTPLFQSSDFALVRYLNTPTSRPAQFDFDGDAKADISIFCDGLWNIQRTTAGNLTNFQFGLNGDSVTPADFDGDGKTDLGIFRSASGDWYWLNSGSNTYSIVHFGQSGDVPVVADYDGDRRADYAVYREGVWYIQRSTAGFLATQFGLASDKPVPADYDGDGKTDIAIYRASSGQWWINRSASGGVVLQFGTATDKVVPADYTGDGKADVAFWRPSTGEWFVLRSENQSYYSASFGQNGDIPVAGDYDGDGKSDMAVYRAGQWWIWQSRTGSYSVQQFGNSDDMPVPSAFIR